LDYNIEENDYDLDSPNNILFLNP